VLKYRIEFAPSRKRYICLLVLYTLLLLSLFSWQQDTFAYQLWVQVTSALVLMLLAFRALGETRRDNRLFVVVITEQGEWLYVDRSEQSSWRLTGRSRISSQVLWLHLEPKIAGSKPRWVWVFNDQVNEQDYRRLCRCILYQQGPGQVS
jgi:hypothetical protein